MHCFHTATLTRLDINSDDMHVHAHVHPSTEHICIHICYFLCVYVAFSTPRMFVHAPHISNMNFACNL
jgi:hypothetical protein